MKDMFLIVLLSVVSTFIVIAFLSAIAKTAYKMGYDDAKEEIVASVEIETTEGNTNER